MDERKIRKRYNLPTYITYYKITLTNFIYRGSIALTIFALLLKFDTPRPIWGLFTDSGAESVASFLLPLGGLGLIVTYVMNAFASVKTYEEIYPEQIDEIYENEK